MYELSVKNSRSEVLNLTGNKNYNVIKITGLQPPVANVSRSPNATSDGSKQNNVRVAERNLVIYVVIEGDIEANRINLYRYFPLKQSVTVYYKNNTRDVYIEGTVDAFECDQFTNKQVAQISLICTQPYFVGIDELVTSFSDVSSLFSFPFSMPAEGVELSAITVNSRKSIINTGDIETGVKIELYAMGEVVNPVLYDVLNRTQFKLRFTMLANDRIVINTNTGNKSVTLIRDGIESNIIGYMYPNSTWFTLMSGDNVFTYNADSGNSNLQITFTSSVLYGGV